MLHVLLVLLKILGIIVLFLLLFLLILLITPFRYQFELKKAEKQSLLGHIKVTWFIKAVQFTAAYEDHVLGYELKILWFRLLGNQPEDPEKESGKKKDEKTEERNDESEQKELAAASLNQSSGNEAENINEPDSAGTESLSSESAESAQTDHEKDESTDNLHRDEEKADKLSENKTSDDEKDKESLHEGKGGSGLLKKAEDLKKIYDEYAIADLLSELWTIIRKIIVHVFPRKLSGYIRFGFDDPALTGYATGFAATLYPLYGKNFTVTSDFVETCFDADCCGRGRIRPLFFVYILIRLLLNKNVRKLIRLWRKGRG